MKKFIFFFSCFLAFFNCFVFCVIDGNSAPTTRSPLQVEELPWLTFFDRKSHSDGFGGRGKGWTNLGLTAHSTLCPPGETGQFPYPPDCKRFINCWKGRGSVQVCAPGTLFNPETNECDFPGKVKCEEGDELPTPTGGRYVRFPNYRPEIAENPRIARKNQNEEFSKPDSIPARPYPGRPPYFGPSHLKPPTRPGNQSRDGGVPPRCTLGATGLYPHPYDCTKFLKCWSGNTFIQSCGPGTFFNPLISACDHPRNVPCAHEQQTYQPGESPEITAEDLQVPEESVRYEQYQDVNQGVTPSGKKGGKKTVKQLDSPNYEENPQAPIPTSTPKSEVDDLEAPAIQTNLTHRKPKVINTGGNHQQNQFSNSYGKEPASYLTPPQYDVYGNLIGSNGNNQAPLGVQPGHSSYPITNGQSNTKTTGQNQRLPSYNPFMNYPPQGPYSSFATGEQKGGSDKTYYGYLLNKKNPHQQQQQQQQQKNHPVHPVHPHHPHHPHHHHPLHLQSMYPHYLHSGLPTGLEPPPFQSQYFPHYAPSHPFFPKTEISTPYNIPQGSFYPGIMQIPYYPITTASNPCPSPSVPKGGSSNEPSAPKCEPGLTFYQPGSSDGIKTPQSQSNNPEAVPSSLHPTNPLQPMPGSINYFPGIYSQQPVATLNPQYRPSSQFGYHNVYGLAQAQPSTPSGIPQTPTSNGYQPGSAYKPQLQPSSNQQTGNPNLRPDHSSGSAHESNPQSNVGSVHPSAHSQTPNGFYRPGAAYKPQVSTHYPQQPGNSVQYKPGSYYGPQIDNQNIDQQPQSSTEKIYSSVLPQTPDISSQNQPGSPQTAQNHPYPFNYYPIDSNLYPQFLPGYYPSQTNPQTPPNTPNSYPLESKGDSEQGQVPLPDPFSTGDKSIKPSAPNYVDASQGITQQTTEGQVQVPDPFFSNKNYISKDNEYQPSKQYPVYPGRPGNLNPTKTSEKIQGSPHLCIDNSKKSDCDSNTIAPVPVPLETATFPPFPGKTEKPKTGNIKTGVKSKPKEYLLEKIDVRVKEEENNPEEVENFDVTTEPPRKKGSERVDETFVKENPKKSIHTLPDKYSQPEESNGVDEAKKKEPNKGTEDEEDETTKKKTLQPESDFSGYQEEEEKRKKAYKKPYIKVKQPNPKGQTVRLRNGASHLDGYLEMRDPKSKWGLVCDESGGWGIAEATVACRGLGFLRGAELSWQGYPIKSESEDVYVAVNGVNCTGEETALSECKIIHKKQNQCDIGRNAVGLRCFDNLASHCQPGEILYNQHCYKLHGKENPDDPWIKVEEASEQCKKFGGKLVDLTSQNENDFISEWLIKKYPDVTAVATGGIGTMVLGRPIWLWEGSSDPMVYERWWSAWPDNQNMLRDGNHGPLCIVLRKTISCIDGEDEGQKNTEPGKEEEPCVGDYFFWDVEDCDKIRTSVFICERPMDDIGCVVGNGEGYVGTANTTASGLPCLPWDHPKVVEGLARRGAQERSSRLAGHNYCRNLGNPDRHPWCFVEGRGNSEYCAIPQCWDSVSGYSRSSGSWPSCDQNHFECKPGECIKKEWVCDGQKDCTNGHDEDACKVFIQEFTSAKNKRMRGKGNEKWPNVNENTCAKLCLENKNFKCKSFSYNARDKDCLLSETNVGLSGQVVNARGWVYHERSTESVLCTIDNGFFGCHNGKCINISNVCDGKKNCEDGSDERDCGRLGYAIRLTGSQERHKGRVEVKILGKWGVICDDKFDMRDAEVVCRELGFKLGAAEVLKHSEYPVENPLFLVDHLECRGNETSIRECPFPGWGKHNCGPEEVVGVSCRVPGRECPEGEWQCKKSKECISLAYLCDTSYDCYDKTDEDRQMCDLPTQIRLAGGPNATSGRLEIRHFGIWGTVCHDDFTAEAASAVCSMLGFNGASVVKKGAYFGAGSGPIWLGDGVCFMNEKNLTLCTNFMNKPNNCNHDEDVSVICSQQESNQKSSATKPIAASYSDDNVQRPEVKLRQVLISECSGKPKPTARVLQQNYEKVVGGNDVAGAALPWQASVRVKSGGGKSIHWCGAIVISPYHVLTAGHCLRDYNKAAYFIRVGDYDTEILDPHEQEFRIEHLYMHPEFSKNINLNNDIGLVKIKGEIALGAHIKPACLAPSVDLYQPGINCSVSGWGSVSAKSAGYAKTLRRAFVPILEPSTCRAPYVYGESLSEGMFCAGYLDGGVDSCQGDSGGPLMCQHEGREYLFGITSWGVGCGRANKPGVYTNVAHYADWIQQKIQSSLL